jgi:hypothetical protein
LAGLCVAGAFGVGEVEVGVGVGLGVADLFGGGAADCCACGGVAALPELPELSRPVARTTV